MFSKVRTSELSAESAIRARISTGDYLDCYSVPSSMAARDAANVIADFPGWVKGLVRLRGLLVAPFGLKAAPPSSMDQIGFFPVESADAHEVIAGFNDKHLDFRIIIRSRDGMVSLATWVRRHNLGGRIYLSLILPFHVLIARNALARVARRQHAPV